MVSHNAVKLLLSTALTSLFVLHAGGWWSFSFLHQLESIAYDARLNLTLPGTVDNRIVIVDIDERSLRAEGQWPWPRYRLAALVDQLFERYHVAVLGFDVVFAEPDSTDSIFKALIHGPLGQDPGQRTELVRLRRELDPDRRFAVAMHGHPVVLGYFFNTRTSPDASIQFGLLPKPIASIRDLGVNNTALIEAVGYGANLPLLQDNAYSGGFFNSPLVDRDGIFRRIPLLIRYRDYLYSQIAVAMVRALLDNPPMELVMAAGYGADAHDRRLEALRFGGFTVPVDDLGAVLVPYRGRQGSFPYVSATEVLAGTADPRLLEGAIVLVGTTAAALLDLRATPVQNVYPGVEINANLIAGILDQGFRTRPVYSAGLEIVQLVIVGLLGVLIGWLSPMWALLLTLTVGGVLLGVNGYLWQAQALVAPLAAPLTLLLILYVLQTSYNFFVESRRERWITQLFGQYVPREIVAEMSRRGERYSLEGESRQMTVLFSDIAGFTTLSERFEPRQLTQLMQCYLTPLTRIIHEHRGTIDKYIGDAIMAFWSAPLADPEHARHAVAAALAMARGLRALDDDFRARGWPPLRARTGINSGVMSVGNMGSEFRVSYTVLGDAVNLASRLEGAAKQYGVEIVISEYTRALVPDYACRELDRVRVKGRTQPVAIFEPLGLTNDLDAQQAAELAEYEEALRAYRRQDWNPAEAGFQWLRERQPDHRLYALYLERLAALRAKPLPVDWDGVFNLESK
ncbi:MAG: adenylate/guanylate cyclase domain-containing protein [Candidatus Competibacteraceae bacterium]|nr:MAG: adenylate/guanylate cyclase domain-containing protein [Candidatus Competibacteraceae bacterium]